jgi:L-aspartate oxidase
LTEALATIAQLETANAGDADMRNMTATAMLIAASALKRQESRGGHFRSDFPQTDPALAQRTVTTLTEARNATAHAVRDARAAAKLHAVR